MKPPRLARTKFGVFSGSPLSALAGITWSILRASRDVRPHMPRSVRYGMAGAYSADPRERVLAAMAAGESAEAAARRFAVGRATAYRRARALRVDGRRGAKPMGGGPAPRIMGEAEAALRRTPKEENQLTPMRCRERLAKEAGVHVHLTTVHRALGRMGWSREETCLARGRAGSQRRGGGPRSVADG